MSSPGEAAPDKNPCVVRRPPGFQKPARPLGGPFGARRTHVSFMFRGCYCRQRRRVQEKQEEEEEVQDVDAGSGDGEDYHSQ